MFSAAQYPQQNIEMEINCMVQYNIQNSTDRSFQLKYCKVGSGVFGLEPASPPEGKRIVTTTRQETGRLVHTLLWYTVVFVKQCAMYNFNRFNVFLVQDHLLHFGIFLMAAGQCRHILIHVLYQQFRCRYRLLLVKEQRLQLTSSLVAVVQ